MNTVTKSLLVNGTLIVVISLLMFFASTWWRLNAQFNQGEAALRRGDFAAAVVGYESALHMYIPFHPTIDKAARQLWSIAETNERLGDVDRALIAYRSLRSSFYAAHWLITPGSDWIAKCDRKIAALVPQQRLR